MKKRNYFEYIEAMNEKCFKEHNQYDRILITQLRGYQVHFSIKGLCYIVGFIIGDLFMRMPEKDFNDFFNGIINRIKEAQTSLKK